jgi:hypothetical protein
VTKDGRLNPEWEAWFSDARRYLPAIGASGTTGNRPVNGAASIQLYVGQPYFDTTLGYIIHVRSLNPTVWVNGAGTPV